MSSLVRIRVASIPSANTCNPKFVKVIRVTYKFEEVQTFVVRMYDVDSTMHTQSDRVNLESQDFLGEIEFKLAQVMGARGTTYRAAVVNKQHSARAMGHIVVHGEEIKNANAKVTFQLAAERLDNKVCNVVGCMIDAGLFSSCKAVLGSHGQAGC